MFIKCR